MENRKGLPMKPRKPMIAVVTLFDETKDSYWMLPGYISGLEDAGAAPIILPLTGEDNCLEQYASAFDGFLFPGGHDLSPALYGEEARETCGVLCPERDGMEPALFRKALALRKPMLGICRGAQLFNVLMGGTLYQDLPSEYPSDVNHHETPPYDKTAHTVSLMAGGLLAGIVGADSMNVNSYHHQGIREVGQGLLAEAKAPDELVEAVSVKDNPFALAVQWHPEFSRLSDVNSGRIFQSFVEACQK